MQRAFPSVQRVFLDKVHIIHSNNLRKHKIYTKIIYNHTLDKGNRGTRQGESSEREEERVEEGSTEGSLNKDISVQHLASLEPMHPQCVSIHHFPFLELQHIATM